MTALLSYLDVLGNTIIWDKGVLLWKEEDTDVLL